MDTVWFYAKDGSTEKSGPVPENELFLALAEGRLNGRDLAWKEGLPAWQLIRNIPELNRLLPASAAQSTVAPEGLSGWMSFTGIAGIVIGALACLGCFTIITGVPLIIGGIALLSAKSFLDRIPNTDQPELRQFLGKLRIYLIMTGVVYLVVMLGTVLLLSLVVAAMVSGM